MDNPQSLVRLTRVAICICTFRRMQGLRRLLDSLAQLTFAAGEPPDVEVIIVDNDPEESARQTVEALRPDYRWPLTYAVEKQPGIPQARNRCLASVASGTNFVCFVDDDEVVEPAWLDRLLSTQRNFDADVVAGPVLPIFPAEAPDWAREGRLVTWKRHRTGDCIDEARTGNVLFRPELARRNLIRFDEDMALTGGEDKLFFEQLRLRGARMVWSAEALAHTPVPPQRIRAIWFIKRSYRVGTTDARIARLTMGRLRGSGLAAWRAASRSIYGVFTLPVYLLLGKGPIVYNVSRIAYGIGSMAGLMGRRYEQYATVRRSPMTGE